MTPGERRNPKILNGSRRLRIARGSGMTVTDVNQLVQRFDQAAKMMKTVARGGVPNIPGMGPVPGAGRPGASAKRGKQQKQKGSRSGNPAKRAAENAGIAASAAAAPAGTGFGLGGAAGAGGAPAAPSAEDLAELQKLLGRG